ncbi:hypothetical protein Holit_02982 [Hollandina sp. SP2]
MVTLCKVIIAITSQVNCSNPIKWVVKYGVLEDLRGGSNAAATYYYLHKRNFILFYMQ